MHGGSESGAQAGGAAATPPHMTPPRRRSRVRNPFERALIERLNSHVCSPGMFEIRKSNVGGAGCFKWDIEQASILEPADIVACSSQFDPTPDPVLERKATEAIEKYFSQDLIVPSPFDVPPKRIVLPLEPEGASFTPEVWAKTNLSFQTEFQTEEQSNTNDLESAANASLRRKLNFEAQFSDEEDSVSSFSQPAEYSKIVITRGVKRTLETSIETYSNFDMIERTKFPSSPILKGTVTTRSDTHEEMMHFKSPSISPIRHPSLFEKNSPLESSDNSHHHCDISAFSQSTPEKTGSTPSRNIFERSEMGFVQPRMETKMDISDMYMGKNQSYDFELPTERVSITVKNQTPRKVLRNIVNIIDDKNNKSGDLSKIYHCLTPTKNLTRIKAISKSSPMQMSMDTSQMLSDNAVNMTVVQDTPSTSTGYDFYENSNPTGIQSMDSGFLETFYSENFKSRSSSRPVFAEDGKPVKGIKWKRFDSGFHEEISTEFSGQIGSNDSLKCSRTYEPLHEYLEDQKDLENFDDFNKFLVRDQPSRLPASNNFSTPSKMHYKRSFM